MTKSCKTMENYSDKELLELFRIGENRHYAFNLLVKKFQNQIYWHIRRIIIGHDDTNDVVQNTFLKVWQNLDNFREDSQLFTWLYRIATNESINFLNQKRKKFFIPFVDVEHQLSNKLKEDPYFKGDAIQLKLQKAILKLPEKQRIVFNMRYFEEIKYEDMSEILGTSVGALKASFHIAVKKIEKYLSDD
jgi:RNA polymerase sigma factor (sigma-70 family)